MEEALSDGPSEASTSYELHELLDEGWRPGRRSNTQAIKLVCIDMDGKLLIKAGA